MAGFQAEEWHNEIFTLGRSLRIWSRGGLSREGWTGTQFGSRQRADGGLDKRVAVGMETGGCCQDYVRRWSEWGLVTDQTWGRGEGRAQQWGDGRPTGSRPCSKPFTLMS